MASFLCHWGWHYNNFIVYWILNLLYILRYELARDVSQLVVQEKCRTNKKTALLNSVVPSLLQEWWSTSPEDIRWFITLMVRRDRPVRLTSLHHSGEWAWHMTWRSLWGSSSLLLTATTVLVRNCRKAFVLFFLFSLRWCFEPFYLHLGKLHCPCDFLSLHLSLSQI